MFCGKCGKENVDGVKFCIYCGFDLSKLTPPPSRRSPDTLDEAVTLKSASGQPQYDTLDVAATTGGEATLLANQYRIIKKIGEGGMGVVYLAEDIEMRNRPVAIKVLPPVLARNKRSVENLRDEAITAIKLNHPNIVRLYGFHSDGDIKFLVMEYIDGQTLDEKIFNSASRKLNLDETIRIVEQIATALDYAHSQNPPVIHRDLKSSNVMIDKNGNVKVLDFGIAREIHDSYTTITGKGDTSGTLPYMSPEQVRGQRPSASMDIYSLGIICYECLNGKVPFYTGDIQYQIIHEIPALINGIPDYVNNALLKVLSKESASRPQTAKEAIELLRDKPQPIVIPIQPAPIREKTEVLTEPVRPKPAEAPKPAVRTPPQKPAKSNKGLKFCLAISALVIVCMVLFAVFSDNAKKKSLEKQLDDLGVPKISLQANQLQKTSKEKENKVETTIVQNIKSPLQQETPEKSAPLVPSRTYSKKIAIVNPDHFRILKYGIKRYLTSGEDCTDFKYYSIASASVSDRCEYWSSDSCWDGVGKHQDFLGAILKGAGYDIDFYEAQDLPSISCSDYGIVIVQDPLKTNVRPFTCYEVESGNVDLLEYAKGTDFLEKLKRYVDSGGKLLLVGDAVKLLENDGGGTRLNYDKTIISHSVGHDVSKSSCKLPYKWLFVRGNPFCGVDRTGSAKCTVESSTLVPSRGIFASLELLNLNDVVTAETWSETLYYPSDGISLLDIEVTGRGTYVLDGSTCSPPQYSVTVNEVMKNFMGYTKVNDNYIFYISSDSFFDFHYINREGTWHAGQYAEIKYETTSIAKEALIKFIQYMFQPQEQQIQSEVQTKPVETEQKSETTFLSQNDSQNNSVSHQKNVASYSNGGKATAGDYGSYMGHSMVPSNINDGDLSTAWAGMRMPAWCMVEFGQEYTINRIRCVATYHTQQYEIQLSRDGNQWNTVATRRTPNNKPSGADEGPDDYAIEIPSQKARFIRVVITYTDAPGSHIFQAIIAELQAYGY